MSSSGLLPVYVVAGVVLLVGGLVLLLFAFERTSAWIKQLPKRTKLLGVAAPVVVSTGLIAGLILLFGVSSSPLKQAKPGPRRLETIALDGWAQAFLAKGLASKGVRKTTGKQTASNSPRVSPGGGEGHDPLEGAEDGAQSASGGAGAPAGGGAGTRPAARAGAQPRPREPSRSPTPSNHTSATVVSVEPKDGDTDVPVNPDIVIAFRDRMDHQATEGAFSLALASDPRREV